jgi:serine/alanine adding enzyme
MTSFEIIQVTQAEQAKEWQTFVNGARSAALYHSIEWREIFGRAFGHRSWYLMARDNAAARGILPLVEIKSTLFGHFLVSLPFVNYGGILADTPECETALASAAASLAQRLGVRHLELRQSLPAASEFMARWKLRTHKVSLVVPLGAASEAQWCDLSSRLRGKVRKAEKTGAVFSAASSEGLDDFYRVFCLNMRDLGSPVHSPLFFRQVMRYAKQPTILLVRRAGKVAAGAIALRSGARVELPWICSDYSQSSHYVNEFLYWNAIEWARKSGARELDLGRSSIDAGTYRFKMQWNPEVRPLSWYYWMASGAKWRDLSPDNRKYAVAIRCWKKMPVALANRLGPLIVRNIP